MAALLRALTLLAVCFASSLASLHFVASDQPFALAGMQLFYDGYHEPIGNISGIVDLASPAQGDFMLVFPGSLLANTTHLLDLMLPGIRAILVVQSRQGMRTAPGSEPFYYLTYDQYKLTIPVYQATTDTADEYKAVVAAISNDTSPIRFTIVDDTPNLQDAYRRSTLVTVFSWILFSFTAITIMVLTYKLAQFIHRFGLQFSIPQMCLILDGISLFLKLFYLALDPFSTRKVLAYQEANVLITIHYPFFLSACILLVFYWYELGKVSTSHSSSQFIRIYRIPAYVFIAVLFVVETITQILRQIGIWWTTILSGAVYALAMVATASLYFFSGFTLIYRVNNMLVRQSARKRVLRIATLVFAAGICLLAVLASALVLVTPLYPPHQFAINYVVFTCSIFVTLLHSLSFHPRPSPHSSSHNSRTDSKP